ncbi:MAG: hypothetical protein CSA31_01710 [Desulfobulbus propionicus]|nr:MAG: hypothetical protein CSA31_01710 [Desulfobulbus propionicus]
MQQLSSALLPAKALFLTPPLTVVFCNCSQVTHLRAIRVGRIEGASRISHEHFGSVEKKYTKTVTPPRSPLFERSRPAA